MDTRQKEILRLIDSCEIISFDIFDTLITRAVLDVEDVFKLTELRVRNIYPQLNNFDFFSIRKKAVLSLLKRGVDNPTIDLIYKEIRKLSEVGGKELQILKQTELEVEKQLSIPRKDIKFFFDYAKSLKKEVVLVSDMYFVQEDIGNILRKAGYDTQGVSILISCEHGLSKETGKLWEVFRSLYPQEKWFHIGDNFIADYRWPKKYGACLYSGQRIKSVKELFQEESRLFPLSKYLNSANLLSKIVIGYIAGNYLFNSPFGWDQSREKIYGPWLGPIMLCFCENLIKNSKNTTLLFVTRDGYVFLPLYESYCLASQTKMCKHFLFYSSRVASSVAASFTEDSIQELLDLPFKGSIEDFLAKRLNFECKAPKFQKNKVEKIQLPRDRRRAAELIKPVICEILQKGSEQRDYYKKYLKQLGVTDEEQLCLVDIGYTGRTQCNLSKILNRKVSGAYLVLDSYVLPKRKNLNFSGVIDGSENNHPILDNLFYLESALQVNKPTVVGLKEENGLILPVVKTTPDQTDEVILLKELRGFIDYFGKWKKFLGEGQTFESNLAEDIWVLLLSKGFMPENMLKKLNLTDEFLYGTSSSRQVFNSTGAILQGKSSFKNFVKRNAPFFLYNHLRSIWLKYLK